MKKYFYPPTPSFTKLSHKYHRIAGEGASKSHYGPLPLPRPHLIFTLFE